MLFLPGWPPGGAPRCSSRFSFHRCQLRPFRAPKNKVKRAARVGSMTSELPSFFQTWDPARNGLHTWPGQGSLFLDLEGTWVFSTTVKCMIPADTFLFPLHKLLVGNAVACERWAPTFLETTVFAIRVSRVCSLRCVSVNRAASITLEATCWPLRGQPTTRSANGVCVLGHCSPRGCLGRD